MRFEPSGGLTGRAARAGGQVDLPPRRAARRDGLRARADRELPARRRHDLHAGRPCARSARSWRCAARRRVVVRGTGLREAREPDGPIDVGNAGTLLRLLPGWLAAQEGRSFTLDGDESIRRRPVDRIAEPLRLMGAELDARRWPLSAADRTRRARCARSPTSCRSRAPRSSPACCSPRWPRTAPRPSASPSAAATTPSGCSCAPASASTATAVTSPSSTPTSWCSTACAVPGDPSSAAFLIAAGVLVPGSRLLIARRRRQLDAHRLPADPAADARDRARRPGGRVGRAARRRSPSATSTSPTARSRAPSVEPEEVPLAIDELPLGRAARLLRRGRDGRARRQRAARQGVRPDRRRRRRPARARARRSRRPRMASRCAAPAACAAA